MRRTLALLLGVLIVLSGVSLTAGAAEAKTSCPKLQGAGNQYPPGQCKGATSQSTVCPGKSLTVSGDGFPAGATTELELDSAATSLGSATADAAGQVSKTITIPTGTALGQHVVSVYDAVVDRYLTANVDVSCDTGAGVSVNAVSKKSSGMSTTALVLGGIVLLGLASLLPLLIRRRRDRPVAS